MNMAVNQCLVANGGQPQAAALAGQLQAVHSPLSLMRGQNSGLSLCCNNKNYDECVAGCHPKAISSHDLTIRISSLSQLASASVSLSCAQPFVDNQAAANVDCWLTVVIPEAIVMLKLNSQSHQPL